MIFSMRIKKIWSRVKALIKAKGISQEAAAKSCGIPFNTLRGWMAKGYYPPLDDSMALARYLGVSLEYLVYGKEIDPSVQLEKIKAQLRTVEKQLGEIGKH